MAEVSEKVQRLKVEGSESGIDQVNAKLKNLGGAMSDMGDQFSKSMQKQQQFSASTDRSFAELIPVFDAAKVAAIAALGAIGAAVYAVIKSVTESNEALEKMEASAKRAGLSLEQFNELKHVATEGKVSEDSFAGTAEQVAKLLNDARYGQTELGRLLDANNVKYKRGNDLLIDTNKLFDVARDLIRRAGTEQDKIRIAEMLGLTKEWVPALDKTREEFVKIGAEASALGIKIDSDAIELAKKFEEEWKKSGDVFSTAIKASLQGLLPWIDKLIEKAKEFGEAFKPEEDAPKIDDLRPTGGRSVGESKENLANLTLAGTSLKQAWDEFLKGNFESGADRLTASLKLWTNQADEATKALIKQADALRVVEALMSEFDQAVDASVKGAAEGGWPKFFKDNEKMLDEASKMWAEGGRSKIPTRPGSFENVDKRLEERMEEMQIEIEAAGRSTEAVTRLRIAYELERAAKKDGIAVDKEKIAARAAEYAATERLRAQARLIGDVRFDRDQIGRTDIEAAVASRLKGAGLDVNLDSSVAQMIRFNEQLKTAKDLSSEFALSFVRDIRNGVNALQALQNALNKVLDTIIEMAVKAAVAKSVGAASGFNFGSLFGGGSSYGGGGVGDQGPTLAMVAHSGGIAGMGGGQRYVHPAVFADAPRYHVGVDEVPAILQRGEEVIPRGGRSSRAPIININVTNNGSDEVQTSGRQNADGGIDIDVLIERKVNKIVASGGLDGAMGNRYGAGPRTARR